MANIQIWDGTATFTAGQSTPFGFYDDDLDFQDEAPKVANYCAIRLGYPLMDVELNSGSFFACFEEAVTTYGNEVYQAQAVQNYLSLEGGSTSTTLNNAVISPTLQNIIRISAGYGTEATVGGTVTRYSGSLAVQRDKQTYDLNQWAIDEGIQGRIEITRVFYEAPPAILRYFDPYAGTGTGMQSLMDAFGFGNMSPGVNFLLMPASFDVLKIQAIEFNDQIRKSAYSFEIVNNHLKLFPIPKSDGHIWFEYYKVSEKQSLDDSANTPGGVGGSITNISNVPYENPVFAEINSVGKQWIYKYALALAKELLAYVRGKYTTVPIPGSEATLNQADLLADARTEKEALITNLREILESTSKLAQLERKAGEGNFLQDTLKQIPMVIFVG
jgi:hypothetical protein